MAYVLGVGPIHHAIACHAEKPVGWKELPALPEFIYEKCPICFLYFDKFAFSYHQLLCHG